MNNCFLHPAELSCQLFLTLNFCYGVCCLFHTSWFSTICRTLYLYIDMSVDHNNFILLINDWIMLPRNQIILLRYFHATYFCPLRPSSGVWKQQNVSTFVTFLLCTGSGKFSTNLTPGFTCCALLFVPLPEWIFFALSFSQVLLGPRWIMWTATRRTA